MRKFKKGDKIRCVRRDYGNETVGKVYTFLRYYDNETTLQIECDDDGYPNSYSVEQFVLAEPIIKRNLPEWF